MIEDTLIQLGVLLVSLTAAEMEWPTIAVPVLHHL